MSDHYSIHCIKEFSIKDIICKTLTLDLRVSDGALRAAADGPVPQHQAVGAGAAVAGVPRMRIITFMVRITYDL